MTRAAAGLCLLLFWPAWANAWEQSRDMGQLILGSDIPPAYQATEKGPESAHLPRLQVPSQYPGKENEGFSASGHLPADDRPDPDEQRDFGASAPGQREGLFGQEIFIDGEKPVNFLEVDREAVIRQRRGQARHNFSFELVKDTADYENAQQSFDQTYRDGQDSDLAARFSIGYRRLLLGNSLQGLWGGLKVGVGRNGGEGNFIDGKGADGTEGGASDVEFKLWSAPVDLLLAARIQLFGPLLLVGAEAGPSLLGLWQVRSDFAEEESEKHRRQVGFGHAAAAYLEVNLSYLFPSLARNTFFDYSMTRIGLQFLARQESYDSFLDEDVQVSGRSFGLGLSFDAL